MPTVVKISSLKEADMSITRLSPDSNLAMDANLVGVSMNPAWKKEIPTSKIGYFSVLVIVTVPKGFRE